MQKISYRASSTGAKMLIFIVFLQQMSCIWFDTPPKVPIVENSGPEVRIVGDSGLPVGLRKDAEIYKDTFVKFNLDVVLEKTLNGLADVNLFLEQVEPEYLDFAKNNWLMVNQEWMNIGPEIMSRIDLVLCKTRDAVILLQKYRKKHDLKFSIYYTKFTSEFNESEGFENDFGYFFHGAGKSEHKNTSAVLDCWEQNPELPLLKLTCNSFCYESQIKYKHEQCNERENIELHSSFLPAEQYNQLKKAGWYVVPSKAEGWGHYLHEGRARGAIIITTDAPPMNEFVTDEVNGFLVPPSHAEVFVRGSKALGAMEYSVDPTALSVVVKKALAMGEQERAEMSRRAKESFLEDKQFFNERMSLLIGFVFEDGGYSRIENILE